MNLKKVILTDRVEEGKGSEGKNSEKEQVTLHD